MKITTWEEYHKIQDNWIPKVGDSISLRDIVGLPYSWADGFTGKIIKVESTDDPIWKHYDRVRLLTVRIDDEWRNNVIVNGLKPKKIDKVLSVRVRYWTKEIAEFYKNNKKSDIVFIGDKL